MTETTVKEIVRRAVSDAAFRSQLRSDPGKALAGTSLTAEERTALASGDPSRLTALGVDQRMSKAFAAGVLSEVSKAAIGDPLVNDPMFYSDETTGSAAVSGDPASPASAVETSYGTTSDYLLRTTEGTIDTAAIAASPFGTATDHLLRTAEGNIDTSAAVGDATYGTTSDYLLRTAEGNIDTSSALEPSYGGAADHMLHTTEGTIDTGAVVDPSLDAPTDVQITGDATPTDL